MIPTVLLVEDDPEIHELLKTYLQKEGYRVNSAWDGETAAVLFGEGPCHLAIVDLMVPKMNGYELLELVRKRGNVPVLIISSKNDELDKIIGLRLGADDYLCKPFGLGEFMARVKALLRRYLELNAANSGIAHEMSYRGLYINESTHEVTVDGVPQSLSPTEFEILKLLMSSPSKVFSKLDIFQSVWKQDYLSDENTIMVHMRRLRSKIEKDPSHPKYIQTVWGVGYKLGGD